MAVLVFSIDVVGIMRRIHAPYPTGSLCSCKFDPVKFVAPTGEVLSLSTATKKVPRLNSLGTNLNSCFIAGPQGKT